MWVRVATFEGGSTEKLRAMAEESGTPQLAPGMSGGMVFATADGSKRMFVAYFDDKESLDAASEFFDQMGDEIPEEIRGRRVSVDAYEVVMNTWEQ